MLQIPKNRDLLLVALLFLIIILFFGPMLSNREGLIWPRSGLGSDISNRHWQDFIGYASNLREGRLALWDSSNAFGRPLAGDPGVLFLYPFDVLFLVFPPGLAITFIDAVHVFLGGLFTYLLLRFGYELKGPGALFGALAFSFAPKLIAHLAGGHVGLVWGIIWAPAVLLGLKLSLNGGSLIYAALAGLAMAIQMPTHIQMPFYTAVVASFYWLWHFVVVVRQSKKGSSTVRSKELWRAISIYGLWLLTFFMFSAVVLLPLLELIPFASRDLFTLEDATLYSLPPLFLMTLLSPTDFQFPEWTIYLGILPLILGLLGISTRKNSDRWFFSILIVFGMVYAVGAETPLFGWVFKYIPGFNYLRIPTRFWFFSGLAMAILAGHGLSLLEEKWLRNKLQENKIRIMKLFGIYFVYSLSILIGTKIFLDEISILLARQIFVLLVSSIFLFRWLSRKVKTVSFQWILILLLVIEMIPLAYDHIQVVIPEKTFLVPSSAMEYVAAQEGIFRIYSTSGTPGSVAAALGVEALDSLLAFQIGHAVDAIRDASGCDIINYETEIPPCLKYTEIQPLLNAKLMGELNVKYILANSQILDDDFRLVLEGNPAVYENLLWQERFRLRNEGDFTIRRRDPGDYEFHISSPDENFLEVRETWLPGWQATDNGSPISVQAVQGLYMGIPIGAGEHQIHLFYYPENYRIALVLFFSAVFILTIWILVLTIPKIYRGTTSSHDSTRC